MTRIRLTKLFIPFRVALCGPEAYPLHDHDCGEIAWVDKGEFTHRVNGQETALKTGDLLFIRPSDCHSFHSKKPFSLINIAFQWHVYEDLKRRYFPDHFIYGENRPAPKVLHLSAGQLKWAREAFVSLLKAPKSPFFIERFLMNLFAELCPPPERKFLDNAPQWMQRAWHLIQRPEHLGLGVPEFYRLCGRSPEHVSREFRKQAKQTVVQSILHLRLIHAAALLAGTTREIIDISTECGFESLSHFYISFRKMHHTTPKEFQKEAQARMYDSDP